MLRYNSEEMDLEKGDSVIRGVMKNIVYHDEALDMTKGVMQYLDQTMKVANSGAAAAPKRKINCNQVEKNRKQLAQGCGSYGREARA